MTTEEFFDILGRTVPTDTTFVCSLGRTSEEAFARFRGRTLFLDSMGDVMPLACGVALGVSESHPVVALDTDGGQLMGLAALPTVAQMVDRLSNLLVVVFDNGIYESAGGLPSRSCTLDWTRLGEAFGLSVCVVDLPDDCAVALASAFHKFAILVVSTRNGPGVVKTNKTQDGIESRYVFVRHLERLLGKTILRPATKS